MKTKSSLSILVAIMVLVAVLSTILMAGCATQPTPQTPATSTPQAPAAPQAPKILKWAYNMPKAGAIVRGWEWFASELEKQTNGRYKIDFYPSASLIKESEQLEAIVNGVTEFSNCGINSHQQQFTVSTVVSLPSVHFPDTKEGHATALDGVKQMLAKYQVMANEFKNYKLLTWNTLPANMIVSKNTKIVVPDDLKGVKLASQGNDKDMVQAAGGVAVSMPPAEVYQSMDKGVVEAATVSWIHLTSNHYEEIAQYYLDITLGNDCQTSIMSLNAWNALPADVQKIITDLIPETMARSDAAYMTQMVAGRKLATDKNRTITKPTDEQRKLWENLAQSIDSNWLSKVKAKNISEGPEILNYLKQRSAEAWAKNP
jgi:TRAP-type C4-dicarboxylate transport system substrate-binding protein